MSYNRLLILTLISCLSATAYQFRTNYTIDEYKQFYNNLIESEKLSDYMTVDYTPQSGFHTIASKKAVEKTNVRLVAIPSTHFIGAWDNFRYKEGIVKALRETNVYKSKSNQMHPFSQHAVLAIRLALEWKLLLDEAKHNRDHSKNSLIYDENASEQIQQFWAIQMAYWRQLKLDDLGHWNKEQMDQLQARYVGKLDVTKPREFQKTFSEIMQRLEENEETAWMLEHIDDQEEFTHWFSVVKTRNHGLDPTVYMKIRKEDLKEGRILSSIIDIKEREEVFAKNQLLNTDYLKNQFANVILPVLDLMNHWHPTRFYDPNYISFNLFPATRAKEILGQKLQQSYISIITSSTYALGQEMFYTYSKGVFKPANLLSEYGFVVENNVFAEAPMTVYYPDDMPWDIKLRFLLLCYKYQEEHQENVQNPDFIEEGCNDHGILPDNLKFEFVLQTRGEGELNHQLFQMSLTYQQLSMNNYHEVNTTGKELYQNDHLQLFASLYYYIQVKQEYETRGTFQQDQASINSLVQQYGTKLYENEDLRRRLIAIQMAQQQKQVKQIHIKRSLGLCTHIVHRSLMKNLGLAAYEQEAESRDFDPVKIQQLLIEN